jgi:hypothetical protein
LAKRFIEQAASAKDQGARKPIANATNLDWPVDHSANARFVKMAYLAPLIIPPEERLKVKGR